VSWSAVATVDLLAVGLANTLTSVPFSIPSSIGFGDMGVKKIKNVGVAYTLNALSRKIYIGLCSPIICKCQPAHQILTSLLDWFYRYRGSPEIKSGGADLPTLPLADTFYMEP